MRAIRQYAGLMGGVLLLNLAAWGATPSLVPFENNSVVSGRLTAQSGCTKKDTRDPAQVWLSVGQILLYQVEVPVEGSFEFHVVPGKYDLVTTSSKGCIDQKQITVQPREVAQANLKLVPAREPASKKN